MRKVRTISVHVVAAEQAVGLQAVLERCRHRHEVVAGGVVATVHDLLGDVLNDGIFTAGRSPKHLRYGTYLTMGNRWMWGSGTGKMVQKKSRKL